MRAGVTPSVTSHNTQGCHEIRCGHSLPRAGRYLPGSIIQMRNRVAADRLLYARLRVFSRLWGNGDGDHGRDSGVNFTRNQAFPVQFRDN